MRFSRNCAMAFGLVVALTLTVQFTQGQVEESVGDLSQDTPEQIVERLKRANEAQRRVILKHLCAQKGTAATKSLSRAISLVPAGERRTARDLLAQRLQRMTAKTLARYLANMKDDELRLAAARAAGKKRDGDLTGPLIQRLSDPSLLVANAANDSLKIVANRDFGELDADREDQRSATIQRWKKWQSEREEPEEKSADRVGSPISNDHAAGRISSANKAISAKLEAYWQARGIDTQQSCSVSPIAGNRFVAMATLGAADRIALAIDEYGTGRIAYYCDMTTLEALVTAFPDLVDYLGQRQNPRVLVFGYAYLCKQLGSRRGFDWVGVDLPPKYAGHAVALAKDYDVVIFGVRATGDGASWKKLSPTLREFARANGRGLMLVADYYPGGCTDVDFEIVNSVANDAKAQFNKVSIGWERANFDQ